MALQNASTKFVEFQVSNAGKAPFRPATAHKSADNSISVFIPLPTHDESKINGPFAAPIVSEELAHWLGRLICAWSVFENQFDRALNALVDKTNTHISPRASISQKVKRFESLVAQMFQAHPAILKTVQNFLASIDHLRENRNLIMHGRKQFAGQANSEGTEVKCYLRITGLIGKGAKTIQYSSEDLESIYYDICHLAGELHAITEPSDWTAGLMSKEEKELMLKAFAQAASIKPGTPDH